MKALEKVKNNRWERIWLLAKIEFKLRYYESKLGLIWAFFKPLFQMLIYYVAFVVIMDVEMEHYAMYLFCGLLLWGFFTESSSGMIVALQTKRYLYEYSNMSKWEIYLSSIISISIGYFFNIVVFLIIMQFDNLSLGWNTLWYPIVFAGSFVMGLGFAMILSVLFLLAKDVKQLWPLVMQMLFWISPLLFVYNQVLEKIPFMNYVNPTSAHLINTRETLMYNRPPDFELLLVGYGHAIVLFGIGYLLLKKYGSRASEML